MFLRSLFFAAATASTLGFSAPVFAQEATADSEYVSADVDIAIWCGALFYYASQGVDAGSDQFKSYDEAAKIAYGKARVALEADGIDPAEYERIISHYGDLATAELSAENSETRYTEEECIALVEA